MLWVVKFIYGSEGGFLKPAKFRIVIFYLLIMFFWMALYAYMPILSTHAGDMGADDVLTGSIISAYGLVQMILRIPLGILSDKIGRRKPFVILGAMLTALSAFGLGLAEDPMGLLIFRGIAGSAAATWVSYTVLFSSYFPSEESPQAMSVANAFNNGGQVIAMLSGSALAGLLGNQTAFFLACGFGLAALVCSFFIAENRAAGTGITVKALLSVGLDKNLLFVSLLAVFYQAVAQGTTTGFVPKLAREIGATTAQLGWITAITVAGGFLTSILSSKYLIKRFSSRRVVIFGSALSTVTAMLLPWIAGNVPVLLIMQFIVGLGNGMNYPILMGLAIQNIGPSRRGAAMGFFQSIYALGMFIGPVLTGWLSELFDLRLSLCCIAGIGIPSLILALLFLGKIKSSKENVK